MKTEILCKSPAKLMARRWWGIEDDYIVGGELDRYDDRAFTYSTEEFEHVLQWVKSEHFDITPELIRELRKAAEPR